MLDHECRETDEGVCDALDLLDSLDTIRLDQLDAQLAEEDGGFEATMNQEHGGQSTGIVSSEENGKCSKHMSPTLTTAIQGYPTLMPLSHPQNHCNRLHLKVSQVLL